MASPSSGHIVDDGHESIGDLVALAASDISQLVKCQLDLAKMELREDARQLAFGGALLIVSVFTACLILVMLCFAFAYGLMATGIPFVSWGWGAFLIVAFTCLALAALAALVGRRMFQGLNGMSKTRGTVSSGVAMLRRAPKATPPTRVED